MRVTKPKKKSTKRTASWYVKHKEEAETEKTVAEPLGHHDLFNMHEQLADNAADFHLGFILGIGGTSEQTNEQTNDPSACKQTDLQTDMEQSGSSNEQTHEQTDPIKKAIQMRTETDVKCDCDEKCDCSENKRSRLAFYYTCV